MENAAGQPIRLSDLQLNLGKHTRLYRLLYGHGTGNGTLLLLPLDQGSGAWPPRFLCESAKYRSLVSNSISDDRRIFRYRPAIRPGT